MEATFQVLLRLEQKEESVSENANNTKPMEYEISVSKLKGKVNLAVLSRERFIVSKWESWPEVRVQLIVLEI